MSNAPVKQAKFSGNSQSHDGQSTLEVIRTVTRREEDASASSSSIPQTAQSRSFIQHRDTGLFFAGPALWVTDTAEARCFKSPLKAFVHAAQRHLEGVQVLVLRTDAEPDVFPVSDDE